MPNPTSDSPGPAPAEAAAATAAEAALVSVVVPTRNVARTLGRCLESVLAQSHPRVELIVIDNHSEDETLAIARTFTDAVHTAGPERSAQRNLGYELAQGEWIAWIDADMILSPELLRNCLAVAGEAGAQAVSIPEVSIGPGFWTRCRALERSCYLDDPGLFNPRLLRRGLLEAMGGFAEQMAGPEDADLRIALRDGGVRVAMATEFIAHDEGRLTLGSIVGKRVYYGRSLPAFARSNPGATASQGRATARALWRHRRDLARSPARGAGVLLMRATEAAAYGYGAWKGGRDDGSG